MSIYDKCMNKDNGTDKDKDKDKEMANGIDINIKSISRHNHNDAFINKRKLSITFCIRLNNTEKKKMSYYMIV